VIFMQNASPREFFTEQEQQLISNAIHEAEHGTTGEICVRIEKRCPDNPLKHTKRLLHALGFSSTQARTAILIYISLEDRKVAIYGDSGIHQKMKNDGWQSICNDLVSHFRNENFVAGITDAIAGVGKALKEHFPATEENPNELPDKPSFG
jgi:uncharacterized membrane protein